MQEIWKDIPGYEGRYQVSNTGRVIALNYKRSKHPHEIAYTKTHDGYYRVSLCKGSRSSKKLITVHILVARTFIPNPKNKPQVNHIDGNKENNCVSNLEWVTGKENISHAISNGLRPRIAVYPGKGINNSSSKPILQYDKDGNLIKQWDCVSDAAREYNCLPSTIINCAKGRLKSCKGFMWRYPSSGSSPNHIEPLHYKYSASEAKLHG